MAMALTRISITIPGSLVTALDRTAKALDRSRSWVIAEAARRFLDAPPLVTAAPSSAVREPVASYGSPGLSPSRLQQLEADLALSPTERVRAAEQTARAVPRTQRRAQRVVTFDRYEDYLDWQRREGLL